ncbi:MAG: M48 family metallopeptidase [Candidatus Omnitrophota bacterium]
MVCQARSYFRQKYALQAIDTFYTLVLLFVFLGLGISVGLETLIRKILQAHFVLPAYLFVIFILYFLCAFPLNFYRSFILEHNFSLSKQALGDWWLDQLKSGVVAYLMVLLFVAALLYLINFLPHFWWLGISVFWIFCSFILVRLAPVVIMPLFFKYTVLTDELLRSRIMDLARKMQIGILDVFQINLSKKSLKANAAFTGMGKSRRVILADTLKDKYSYDEIEVILAHEFAHYKLKHIVKLLTVNCIFTFLLFYIIFKSSGPALAIFNLNTLNQPAAVPLFFAYFILFGIIMQPLEALFSRRYERSADKLALETTRAPEAFISMMNKLAEQNLADRAPHPLIKFFFFDHPPIDERIQSARSFQTVSI